MLKVMIMISFCFLSNLAFAAKADAVKAENFRCEKLAGHTIAEFKSALVENCNLNVPFSSSMSRLLNEETYFYCCQKK